MVFEIQSDRTLRFINKILQRCLNQLKDCEQTRSLQESNLESINMVLTCKSLDETLCCTRCFIDCVYK